MIHVFFSASAAGTFGQLLDTRGIDDRIAALSDHLDYGPISNNALAVRETWLNTHVPLDFGDCDWIGEDEDRFRRVVESDPDRLVWIAPASAAEQSGLYWYLSQFGGLGTTLALADYPLGRGWNGGPPLSLGELGIEPMAQLYDTCPRIPWDQSRFPEDRWGKLVAEDALLRVVLDGELQTAPEALFDHLLLARCRNEWTKWHRVIGDVMGDIWQTGQTADSTLLLWRLRDLIARGVVACDGEAPLFGSSVSDAVKIRRVQ